MRGISAFLLISSLLFISSAANLEIEEPVEEIRSSNLDDDNLYEDVELGKKNHINE